MTRAFTTFGSPAFAQTNAGGLSNPVNQPIAALLGTFVDGHILASTVSVNFD